VTWGGGVAAFENILWSSIWTLRKVPLQDSTLGVLVAEGGNILGRRKGLWSTEAKMWGIVPKAAWHWGGDSSVTKGPFGAPGNTPSYVCLPHSWGSVGGDFNSPVLVGLIWTTRNRQEKLAKALSQFKFRHFGKHFMEPRDYDETPLCKIPYFARGKGLLAE
jgi:hypothetical protein